MRLIFLGGLFPIEQRVLIASNSLGVVQNAADAFQWALLRGAIGVVGDDVTFVNLPFIGSYPKRYRQVQFPGGVFPIGNSSKIVGMPFLNISGVKLLSRFFSALLGLIKVRGKGSETVIVYSAHMPFMLASVFYRMFQRHTKLCLVVPDLPEYMGDGGLLYGLFKKIDVRMFYWLVKKFDYHVVLTHHMIHRMGIRECTSIVVEGIASKSPKNNVAASEILPEAVSLVGDARFFLYSGTLARRYGVLQLIQAFEMLGDPSCCLLICGDGDARSEVVAAAARNTRIHYLGQLNRDVVRQLQQSAWFLVNPRCDDGEYTSYSFPSKVMEYMASGRPVIMFQLPGIPEEYSKHFFSPNGSTVAALAYCMKEALDMDERAASDLGKSAQEFVLNEKNEVSQFLKISRLINGGKND